MIGYFKEEIFDDDDHLEESRNNVTKSGTSKTMLNPRELFTKDFLMMKTPKIRSNKVRGEFDWA